MKISVLIEGRTEMAFKPHLQVFLKHRISVGSLPKLDFFTCDGRVYTGDKLKRTVQELLTLGKSDFVIALTDVYTGTNEFSDAHDAKTKMKRWVGDEPRFFPHAAQHDFEAWLLPYWPTIQQLAKHNKSSPSGQPESVNHGNPPSYRIKEIFEIGKCRDSYNKPRDANRILKDQDLTVAALKCPELRSFLNTFLSLCGAPAI